jgi:hypothetical protein
LIAASLAALTKVRDRLAVLMRGAGLLPPRQAAVPWTNDELLAAAARMYRGGHTYAGLNLQKHETRPGSPFAVPQVAARQSPATRNAFAQALVEFVLSDPGRTVTKGLASDDRKPIVIIWSSNRSYGIAFREQSGAFYSFREPPRLQLGAGGP